MKNILTAPLLFLGAILSLAIAVSCEKDLPTGAEYTAYTFSKIDENGGNWKPILLDSAAQIAIPAPEDVNSSAYQAELADLKAETASLTADQQKAVEYWTNNPALRWNEIALDLVAKYNLIPGPNDDGTYPSPSATNPGVYPLFPFAHPPYAARALAYMSVAEFDGLIAAWHYKFAYNRPAPSKTDPSITAAYVDNNLPSYPSDGAVVATVAKTILTAMFPLEKDFLEQKAAEHLSSLKWAGVNVDSDIDAGKTIGESVAQLALTRAATDGMKKAQCPKPVADSLKQSALDRFGWAWENIEVPARPVGLTPLFGQVKLWNVPNVEIVRPPAPPAPGTDEFNRNVEIMKGYANNRTVEHRRIANYWEDGLGTYTPVGHWDRFASDEVIKYKLNPLRTVRMFAYLNQAMMDGGICCWDAKFFYYYPRPINLIEGFKTIAGTPNFPSYVSGHSVFSASAAEVLSYIFPEEGSLFRDRAAEASISRVYGGIHWPFDTTVGAEQGASVGQYTVEVAQADGADN